MSEWRPCVGYEGRYEVSDAGEVRNARNGRLRKQRLSDRGYPEVFLEKKTWRVHRLVALAFVPNPENLPTVNHIDRVKANNAKTNLEWASNLDNHRHSADKFLVMSNPNKPFRLSVDDVADIRAALRAGARKEDLAKQYGVNPTTIYRINSGKHRSYENSAKDHVPTRITPRPPERPTAERDQQIYDRVIAGERHASIAQDVGLHAKEISTRALTVWRRLRQTNPDAIDPRRGRRKSASGTQNTNGEGHDG